MAIDDVCSLVSPFEANSGEAPDSASEIVSAGNGSISNEDSEAAGTIRGAENSGSANVSASEVGEYAQAVGAFGNESRVGDDSNELSNVRPEPEPHEESSSIHVSPGQDIEPVDTNFLTDKVLAADVTSRESPEVYGSLANGRGAQTENPPSWHRTGLERSLMDLPADLRKNTTVLNCIWDSQGNACSIYIVGTAHVSKESCKEVQAVIHHLKPQVVFLELCASRVAILTPQNLKVPTLHDMLDMWREKRMNPFGILYSWFLAKVANKLEVFPGAEFRVAYEEALACGAKVTLGDRPVQITLRRTWARMSIWHKIKLIFALCTQAFFLPSVEELNQMLEEMSDSDMITLLIQEMNKSFPTLMETLIDERDLFMTAILQKVARHHSSVVVVVGKGHMPGIIQNWGKDIEINSLLETPQSLPRSLHFKGWATIALAIGGLAIISGVYIYRKR